MLSGNCVPPLLEWSIYVIYLEFFCQGDLDQDSFKKVGLFGLGDYPDRHFTAIILHSKKQDHVIVPM